MPGDTARSCNEARHGCNPDGSPTGLDVIYRGSDGSNVIVEVLIEPEAQDAVRAVDSRSLGLTTISVGALRGPPPTLGGSGAIAMGPCDTKAAFNATNACAYTKYGAPHAGDHALAYTSDAVTGHSSAGVFFARDFLMGRVEVSAMDAKAAKSLANKLAVALDAQMKQALSR